MKAEGHYLCHGELDDHRLQNEANRVNDTEMQASSSQKFAARTSAVKCGSTFWKDCRCRHSHDGSQLGHESSDNNTSDGEQDRLEPDDYGGLKETEKVPADEMLSDEYYEQDCEDQNDSFQYRGRTSQVVYIQDFSPGKLLLLVKYLGIEMAMMMMMMIIKKTKKKVKMEMILMMLILRQIMRLLEVAHRKRRDWREGDKKCDRISWKKLNFFTFILPHLISRSSCDN